MTTIQYLSPRVAPPAFDLETEPPRPLVGQIKGRRIGIRQDEIWESWTVISNEWAKLLSADGAEVELWQSLADRVSADGEKVTASFQDFLGRIEGGIFGMGSCGSCTMLTVSDALELHNRGLPSTVVVTNHFEVIANALATRGGWSRPEIVVLPYPLEGRSTEELTDIAHSTYPRVLATLGATS